MLFRSCLIHVTIIILRHILPLAYLCTCLGLSLFMLYLCDLFFIFSLGFILINCISCYLAVLFLQLVCNYWPCNPIKTDALVFLHFLEYFLIFLDNSVDEESEKFSRSGSSTSECCLDFA